MRALAVTVPILYQWQTEVRATTSVWKPHPITEGLGGGVHGVITLFASFLQPIMTDAAMADLSLVGSVLIFCVGINLVFGKKVSVANMLPSVVFAVIAAFLPL